MLGNGAEDFEAKVFQLGHEMIIHEMEKHGKPRSWLPLLEEHKGIEGIS
jgi:hypothetical protein